MISGRALDTAPPALYTLLEIRKNCPEILEKCEVSSRSVSCLFAVPTSLFHQTILLSRWTPHLPTDNLSISHSALLFFSFGIHPLPELVDFTSVRIT
jgi:hypothetical protein